MNWYGASVFLESVHSSQEIKEVDALWEEVIFLVRAHSEEDAAAIAQEMAKEKEVAYKNAAGGMSEWRVSSVSRVVEIDGEDIGVGTEVFSRFLRRSEVESLRTSFED